MRSPHPLPPILAVLIGVLFVCLVLASILGLTGLWAWGRRRLLRSFAAAEGVSFEAGIAPIAVPQMTQNPPRSLRLLENFLHGSREGVEVFACDFRKGEGRGMIMQSMIAVRSGLHEAGGLDLQRWELLSLGGWTFLVPKYDATVMSRRRIRAAWDLLTAAVRHR